jgi:hypothetical protein
MSLSVFAVILTGCPILAAKPQGGVPCGELCSLGWSVGYRLR